MRKMLSLKTTEIYTQLGGYALFVQSEEGFPAFCMCAVQSKFQLKKKTEMLSKESAYLS